MAKGTAQPKVTTNTEEELKGVLTEWVSLRDELRHRDTMTLQIIGFNVVALVAVLTYGTTAIVDADAESRRWFALVASISGFGVLIPSIIFVIANSQRAARNVPYMRLFLEEEHPGLKWETHLHRFRTLSGGQLGRTAVIGVMYLTVAVAILAASLAGLVIYEGWYLFPVPVAMFAALLYFVRDISYQRSKGWHAEQYWGEIKRSSIQADKPHAPKG